ncbi:MAG: FAD-dependent oxidoreductase [Pseudomonadota bacterium]
MVGSDKSASTIVIGGGIIGVSTLYALAKRGVNALLLEQRDATALETSYANGGMLTPSMPDPWNGPGVGGHLLRSLFDPASAMKLRLKSVPGLAAWGLQFLSNSRRERHRRATLANFKLADYSLAKTDLWRERENVDCAWSDRGTMKLFSSTEAMESSLQIARALEPYGLSFDVLGRDEILLREPALDPVKDKFACALSYPEDRSGDCHLFARGLASAAGLNGASIRTGIGVERIRTKGGAVVGVETTEGFLAADSVIVAAGCTSPQLAARCGVSLPIKPAKGYSLSFDVSRVNDRPRLPVIDDSRHAAIVPIGARIRIAGTAEFAGFDKSLDAARIDNLQRMLKAVYPTLADAVSGDAGEAWVGLRPMSADGAPFIGETRVSGLWVNSGHGHLGWTLAAGSAALLADLLLEASPAIDPAPYRIVR